MSPRAGFRAKKPPLQPRLLRELFDPPPTRLRRNFDSALFLQNITIAARSFGLETCPQAAFLIVHDVLQKRLGIPADQTIVCGMALGYPDMTDQVNTFAPDRMPVRDFVTFVEDVKWD